MNKKIKRLKLKKKLFNKVYFSPNYYIWVKKKKRDQKKSARVNSITSKLYFSPLPFPFK